MMTPPHDSGSGAHVVEALLARMSLDELVGQLHMSANLDPTEAADAALLAAGGVGSTLLASGATAGSVRDQGVSRARTDAIRAAGAASRWGIPPLVARDVIHGHRTVFPIPLGLAASFDEDLVGRVARRIAEEAVADGISWTFAPMIDLVDDARWGRVAESFGEDPLLTGRLGAAMIRGLQSSGSLAACAKHFVGYGLSRGGRDYASVDAGERALRNAHLRPFRAAVDAGVGTVMAAFSDVDGIPMHSHRRLLRGVLKEEWGFRGVVVADWNGIAELVAHGVATDLRDAARQAIEAGVDVDMVSGAYSAHLAALVRDGEVDQALVVDAARRVLTLKQRVGLIAREGMPADAGSRRPPDVGSPTPPTVPAVDRPLARAAAAASLVVLSQDDSPMLSDGPVLVTGAYARERASLLGTWVLDGDPATVPTIEEAFAASPAASRVRIDDGAFPDRTLRRAREVETTVALVGEHSSRSGEDSATADLGLPPGQLEVLRALRTVSRRLVVVVFAGRPLALAAVLEIADTVVLAFHPGTEGAGAVVDLLRGVADAPGRLPMSLPRSSGHAPVSSRERPSGRPLPDDPRGRSRYIEQSSLALLPFGAGRSALTYGSVRAPAHVALPDGELRVEVTVANPTSAAVREPVLLFARDEVAEVTRPLRELVDVAMAEVAAGSECVVGFTLPVDAFAYHGRDGMRRVDAGRIVLTVGWGRPDASSCDVEVRRPG